MKNKGFTLVELLAVIAIIAILAGIAIPNILSMLENAKKEDFIKDAKAVLAQAKYEYNSEKTRYKFVPDTTGQHDGCNWVKVSQLDISLKKSVYDDDYDTDLSWVWYCPNSKIWGISLKSGTKGNGKCVNCYALTPGDFSTCGCFAIAGEKTLEERLANDAIIVDRPANA